MNDTNTMVRADELKAGQSVTFPNRKRATVIEVRRSRDDLVSVLVTFKDRIDTVFGTLTGLGPTMDESWIDGDIKFEVEY